MMQSADWDPNEVSGLTENMSQNDKALCDGEKNKARLRIGKTGEPGGRGLFDLGLGSLGVIQRCGEGSQITGETGPSHHICSSA